MIFGGIPSATNKDVSVLSPYSGRACGGVGVDVLRILQPVKMLGCDVSCKPRLPKRFVLGAFLYLPFTTVFDKFVVPDTICFLSSLTVHRVGTPLQYPTMGVTPGRGLVSECKVLG